MPPAVTVERVSKKFCRRLRYSITYGAWDLARRTLGMSTHPERLRAQEFWAVDEVSLAVEPGECLGIIGPNGAGKSTMLKMLNGILAPDRGCITVRGRVGALIEVGAGFHPLLTGRENIYVNGAILGMSKREIDRRLDEIIAFSGLEEFIDTPIKNYSSGMYVRLGFSVAAHLYPDVLLMDEVLAVGDLSFQGKCRRHIQKLIQQGCAIVFVSHNLHMVAHLCPKTLVLSRGRAIHLGETEQAIDVYRASLREKEPHVKSQRAGMREIEVTGFDILDEQGGRRDSFQLGEAVTMRLHYKAHGMIESPVFNIAIYSAAGVLISGCRTDTDAVRTGRVADTGYVDLRFDEINLLPNLYILNATIYHSDGFGFYDRIEGIHQFRVVGGQQVQGTTYLPHRWVLS